MAVKMQWMCQVSDIVLYQPLELGIDELPAVISSPPSDEITVREN